MICSQFGTLACIRGKIVLNHNFGPLSLPFPLGPNTLARSFSGRGIHRPQAGGAPRHRLSGARVVYMGNGLDRPDGDRADKARHALRAVPIRHAGLAFGPGTACWADFWAGLAR